MSFEIFISLDGWFSLFLAAPIIFGYPVGGPSICEKCKREIPGADIFWDFRFIPYCEECKNSLTEDGRRYYEERRHQYRSILCDILRLSGKQIAYDDAEKLAGRDFVEAVVRRRTQK